MNISNLTSREISTMRQADPMARVVIIVAIAKKAEKVKSKTYTERQSRSSAFYITIYQFSFVINLYPSDVFFTSK